MKKLLGLSLLVGMLFLSGCAISHTYGPYTGKVVDKETAEPIEGAVVFMSFYTLLPTPGGQTSYYADATETLTDRQGQFVIPTQWVWAFRPLSFWEPQPQVIIFRPGYGAFPEHRDTSYEPKGWFKVGVPLTIKLPKLKTREERRDNLGNLWAGSGVPQEKHRRLSTLERTERVELGLKP